MRLPVAIDPTTDLDAITFKELIACLLEGEGTIFLHFLKVGWPHAFLVILKEALIGSLNPLADVLHSLRSYLQPIGITLTTFGNMSLKFCTVQVLAIHAVVALVKGDTVVPNHPSGVNLPLEVSVPLVLV
ncbi:MAG: hypothetical protein DDT26_00208 [Dehalococcoidia bacterium]|nr:hypothetical protein [Chloroflexota bacterium]